MKTTPRFENAVSKLYKAFHEGELTLTDCTKCAVGNICDNRPEWFKPIIEKKGFHIYNMMPVDCDITPNQVMIDSGYSPIELGNIEAVFANGMKAVDNHTKEEQFKGLCAVVEYLCKLDGIPNVMDFTSLFETENDKPKHELQTVF